MEEEAFFARGSDDASYFDHHEHRYRWTPFFFSLLARRRRVVSCAPLCLVPAFIMTTTKKKTKKNGELNCISNAFCMLVHTSYLPLVLVLVLLRRRRLATTRLFCCCCCCYKKTTSSSWFSLSISKATSQLSRTTRSSQERYLRKRASAPAPPRDPIASAAS